MKIHYIGGIDFRLEGWPVCTSGKQAHAIRANGNVTKDMRLVTCANCLKVIHAATWRKDRTTYAHKEKPILFKPHLAKAIERGEKTQTRRILKLPKGAKFINEYARQQGMYTDRFGKKHSVFSLPNRYGNPGDRLWVKETFIDLSTPTRQIVKYQAKHGDQYDSAGNKLKWQSPLFMERRLSRLVLEISAPVEPQMLHDISTPDALAEGMRNTPEDIALGQRYTARKLFKQEWTAINGPDSWDDNPWVWVIKFKTVNDK